MNSESRLIDSYLTKVYQDEPIPQDGFRRANAMPEQYAKMRKIADYSGYLSSDMLFYRQGKFMEYFEDDFEYGGEFKEYFPTYSKMTQEQLRGYFSWRTRLRRGELLPTSLSFVFVYIYELLNQIGVASLIDGFNKLKHFWQNYREFAPKIDRYCRLWLHDYVVYYNLDHALLNEVPGIFSDRELSIVQNFREHDNDTVFAALNLLSPYKLTESRLFHESPEAVTLVTVGVFSDLSDHYRKKSHTNIMEKLFGKSHQSNYRMFVSAVFDEPPGRTDSVYAINDFHQYRCKNGVWKCTRFICYKNKLVLLGALLKNIDLMMRTEFDFKSTLKSEACPKFFLSLIANRIDSYMAEQKRKAQSKIEVDLSKLHQIRTTALVTQSKLIVEVEQEEPTPPPPPAAAPSPVMAAPDDTTNLNDTEKRLLALLLTGGDYAAFARSEKMMLSMLIDAINEKLFDRFGDTAITCDDDTPELIEDYVEELKRISKI